MMHLLRMTLQFAIDRFLAVKNEKSKDIDKL
jgi:hypothetical protein